MTGVVLWRPVELWEMTSQHRVRRQKECDELMNALRHYTTVAVAVGKMDPSGAPGWVQGAELRSHVVLRDSNGVEYPPLETVSPRVGLVATMTLPIFADVIGPAWENMEILFFPAKNENGVASRTRGRKGAFLSFLGK